MLSGRAEPGESRMGESSMSGSTRERGAAVIDAIVFHSVLSSLLYCSFEVKTCMVPAKRSAVVANAIMSSNPDDTIPTRQSLLERLKNWEDQTSWQDFFNTYWKLIYGVARQAGFDGA